VNVQPSFVPTRRALRAAVAAALGAASLAAELPAQGTVRPSTPRDAARAARGARRPLQAVTPLAADYDSLAFANLKWREIGPFRGGRSVAVAGSASRPMEYYMGTTGGGVYKTTDGGMTWGPVTDRYFGGTIGAIAVSESNPDVVYVGGGEFPIRGNVSHGEGVWKSTDAGKTWTSLGLKQTYQISRVRVHPKNPDVVYVAAQGHVFGPNPDRGVFRSKDGGKTWQKVLFRNDSTGAADLAMDPQNPNVLYAGFWQAGRKPWQLISGGPGSGLFKSTDGGDHWTEITRNKGLPAQGPIGNVGLTVSPAKAGRLWAIIEHDSGGVFRSDDAGATWTRVNGERKLRQRAWYYTKIHADSKDSNTVYVNNVSFHRSTDGGKTFKAIRAPHGDSHDFWIAPNDNQRMIEGNDGGANVSFNAGKTWTDQDYATAQFYHVTTTNHFPYRVCGAQQDNSTLCGASRSPGGIAMSDWYDAGGGESGYIAVRPDEPDIMYAGSYGGFLTRKDARTGIERDVNPWPMNPMGHSAGDVKYRFQWTYPIVLSPHDPKTMYVGSSVIFRSTNEGQSYAAISPDLTRNDPATLGPSGGPITKDQTSVEYYATVFAIAESPVTRGVIWAGSDDGLVHVSRDNAKTWQKVTPPDLPEWARISIIEASHHAPGTAYVAANRYQLDDHAPYLYKTTDYGKSWTKIVAGIAPDHFTRVIREDPEKPGLLYAGTERGVYVSFDDGGRWQPLRMVPSALRGTAPPAPAADGPGAKSGDTRFTEGLLPVVPIHDLAVKEGDLVAGTHGRSFWVLDDLSPLRQLSPALAAKPAHLFAPRDAYRVNWNGGNPAATRPTGANPPSGAVVHYWLKDANREVTLAFLDAAGKEIRTFTSRQDSLSARDSVRKDSVKVARTDSLRRTGLSADSIKSLEKRSEESAAGGGGGGGGEEDEDGPRRTPRPPRVPNRAGMNSFVWNLRYPDASSFDNMILWAGGTQGPVAPPGTYAVRMTVQGQAPQTQRFTVKKDPRTEATPAELAEQFAFLIRIRDRVSEANDAVKTIRNVKAQITERSAKVPAAQQGLFKGSADSLAARLSLVEGEIYQVRNQSGQDPLNYPIKLNNKISALAGVVGGTDARPTSQSYEVFRVLSADLETQLTAMRAAMTELLPKVNAALAAAGLPAIVPRAVDVPTPQVAASEEEDEAEEEEAGEERRW
jgi:photosystem II stability/assembly factor-like uncharacterized protein